MPSTAIRDRIRPHAVPVVILALVTAVVVVVPPLVLGDATPRTYAITAAVLLIATSSAMPYALLVGLGTLPLFYAGLASYAAPQPAAATPHSFSPTAALRHAVAGVAYALCATIVGAIGIGAQLGSQELSGPALGNQPAFLVLGGALVAVTYSALQLWRYDTPLRSLDRRTVIGTGVLGVLVALAPIAAFWVFSNVR